MNVDNAMALSRQIKPAKRFHVGPIHSKVAGRTDHLPMTVPSGSYVIPADIVSGLAEGNSTGGFNVIERMFGKPKAVQSEGGVPIVAAGGEYVLSPEQVMIAGEGDMDMGHKALDEFVKRQRKLLIGTLKGLAPPKIN